MAYRETEEDMGAWAVEDLDPPMWAGVETWLPDWREEEPEWTR